jgi:hypothetical protein
LITTINTKFLCNSNLEVKLRNIWKIIINTISFLE